MKRRDVLFGLAGAVACPVCASLPAVGAEGTERAPRWSYRPPTGPESWGDLSAEYAACGTGRRQSPVNLTGAVEAEIDSPAVHWRPVRLEDVVNDGHTIRISASGGGFLEQGGNRYELVQFHFHHRSEHAVDGRYFPMEAHFVHQDADGRLAVLAVFLNEGADNPVLAPIWSIMPERRGRASSGATVHPAELLPARRDVYRYAGSLTTPPCSETVAWTIYAEPVPASAAQIAAFARLFPDNARPDQPLNRRFILRNL